MQCDLLERGVKEEPRECALDSYRRPGIADVSRGSRLSSRALSADDAGRSGRSGRSGFTGGSSFSRKAGDSILSRSALFGVCSGQKSSVGSRDVQICAPRT